MSYFQNDNQGGQKITIQGDEDFTPTLAMSPAPKQKIAAQAASLKTNFEWPKAKGELVVDVFQTDTDFFAQAAIAGIGPENIEVLVENKIMIIRGERSLPERPNKTKTISSECHWGSFARQIALPENIDTRSIKASLKRGILTVQIPLLAPPEKKVSVKIQ